MAQWLALWTIVLLIVRLVDWWFESDCEHRLSTGVSVVDALLRARAYVAPRFTQPNVEEIVHEG